MLKKLILLVVFPFLISSNAYADNITLDFRDAPLLDVAKTVVKGIMGKNFVISPEIASRNEKVTINLVDIAPDTAISTVRDLLQQQGVFLNMRNDIVYLESQPIADLPPSPLQMTVQPAPESEGIFIYQSRYRSLADLTALNQTIKGMTLLNDLAIVRGSVNDLQIAKYLLEQYDRPTVEVEVKASVIEYTANEDSGLNFYAALTRLSSDLQFSIGNAATLRDSITISGKGFNAFLSMIQNDSAFNIVDTSTIRIASGKQGRISIGQEVPVLGQFTLDQQGRNIQSVNYRSSGLIVDIKPLIIDDLVHADVLQQLSSFAVTSTSTIDSPTLLKREITTSLSTPFNQVVLLGGLEEKRDTDAKSGLFGLPLGKQTTKVRSSLFLVLEFQRR